MVRREDGFTLIEMLIVTVIIGILAALAIPHYALFKTNALNATAANDARNIAPAASLVSSTGGLAGPVFLVGTGGPIPSLPGATVSPGTVGSVIVGANAWTIELWQDAGSIEYQLDSDAGMTETPR